MVYLKSSEEASVIRRTERGEWRKPGQGGDREVMQAFGGLRKDFGFYPR